MTTLKIHSFKAWPEVEPLLRAQQKYYKSYYINTAILNHEKLRKTVAHLARFPQFSLLDLQVDELEKPVPNVYRVWYEELQDILMDKLHSSEKTEAET